MVQKFFLVFKRNSRIFFAGIRLNKPFFFVRLFMSFYGCLITVITILLPRFLIEAVSEYSLKKAIYVLAFSLSVNLIGAVTERLFSPYAAIQTEKMNIKITEDFLEKSFSMKLSSFEKEDAYNRYTLVFDHCTSIIHSAQSIFFGFISAIMKLVLAFSVISWINKGIFAFMISLLLLQLWIDRRKKKVSYDYQVSVTKDNRKLNFIYRLFYIPQFMRDIRVNSLKEFVFSQKEETTNGILEKVKETNVKVGNISLIISLLTNIESFFTYLYFVYETIRGTISLGNLFVALNSYSTIKGAITQILSSYNELYANDLYIEKYDEFMNSKEVINDNGELLVDKIRRIEFKNVSFSYPNTTHKALDDVSFVMDEGSKTAIVGKNGAGKTTIIKLILRLYEPDEGMILLNGVDISEYKLSSLRSEVSVLFQDYSIYPFSIRENVCIGKKIKEDDIVNALKKVGMYEKVEKLPLGLDTPITSQIEEKGVEFSGGESQRIAISRAFVSDSEMVILDEPTSNLDATIENDLYSSILDNAEDKMIIIISHRLIFTHRMDRIICIDGGHIVEDGNHEELMRIPNGLYKKMVNVNLQKYAM